MLGLGRLTRSVSDVTIGTAIVLAHVALADYVEQQRRNRMRVRPYDAPHDPRQSHDQLTEH